MTQPRDFDELISEAEKAPFSGWDFSYLKGRYIEGALSWDYRKRVLSKIKGAKHMLDMGTGGGELLSSLQPLPKDSYATEGYSPNVPIAKRQLEPLGVKVLGIDSSTKIPFDNGSLDLVINRHEAYSPSELYRVLCHSGYFLTQQVGWRNNIELYGLLNLKSLGKATFNVRPEWGLGYSVKELEEAGFRILQRKEEFPLGRFYDVGALVYLLKVVPWDVPDFNVDHYRRQLLKIHELIQEKGSLEVTTHRFFIEARKD